MRDFIRAPEAAQSAENKTECATGTITAQVRLLATTDIHLQLMGYNYIADRPTPRHGLAGLATLINTARAEAQKENQLCMLLDNGDLLQGCAMGDWLARRPVAADHPAIAAMNALNYDAIGIGNHDLDFGLDYLRRVARQMHAP
ncbi:hypothetical protein [Sulfitobacter aestuariivivens]